MPVIRPPWESDPVEYLVLWKFPELAAFRTDATRARSSWAPERWQELQNKAEAYRHELWAMSGDNRNALIAEARRDEIRRYNEHREAEELKRFFNQPAADADFAHWASASFWTLDETTALSFGKDPRVATWKAISPHVNISPFAKAFEARRDLVYRAGVMGQLAKQTAPSVVLAWTERMRVPMPAELIDAVSALSMQIADWKTLHDEAIARVKQMQAQLNEKHAAHMATMNEYSENISRMRIAHGKLIDDYKEVVAKKDELIMFLKQKAQTLTQRIAELEAAPPALKSEKPLTTRERESLLKLVIGMAIKGYSYDPKSGRSPTTKEIAGDLALIGLPMDEDTVRKYLAEAREMLPSGEPEQKS